ncbi:MAG: diguanylate cyclase [Micromonosporaceae bacterium]|nr:diguanylate cyclase [Micromonosporaceae bacterium]
MARIGIWYAAGLALLVGVYFGLPIARPAIVGAIGLVAVVAIEFGVRQLRPQRARAWRCLAVAVGLLAIGDVAFATLEARSAAPVPYPSIADVFYVATYVPLTVALFWLGRAQTRHLDHATLIDVISVTLAGSLVAWILVVRPELDALGLAPAGRIVAVASWVGYIAVFAASARVLLCWRRNRSVVLLSVGTFAFLVSEVFYGQALLHGTYTTGGPVDFGYFIFTAMCGAAALHPSMRRLVSPVRHGQLLGPGRLAMIAVGLLVAPTALLVEASLGVVRTGVAIGIVSGLVSVLVLVRLAMTGRAYQRRAAREHAARVASRAMVAATTPTEVVAGTRAAVRSVLRDCGGTDVVLVDPYDPGEHDPTPGAAGANTAVAVDADGQGKLAIPLAGTDAALVFAAPAHELVELTDLLRSLTDQAALALQRIGLARAAETEERERYFRTLVLTSTDVILISRDGRIEYATPSARSLFGRDVVGERFDELVRPNRPIEADERTDRPLWPDAMQATEATVQRSDGEVTVLLDRRDLTSEPTVRGVVTTMRDVTAERELQRDLAYLASHDELTGLANVRAWGEALEAEGERRGEPGAGIAVMFLDLDNFKDINDRYGHPVGDQVLAEVAHRIEECLRSGDLAARVGGDEFAILLRGLSTKDDARGVAQRLADALARPAEIDAISVECRASIGLSYTEGRERVHALVRQADIALYAAKEQGKGRWTEYDASQWAPPRRTHNGTADHRTGT